MLDVLESMAAPVPGQADGIHPGNLGNLSKTRSPIRWRPHDLAQARRNREELPAEERLLLIDLTDVLFERHGQLPDDDVLTARLVGRDIRVWRRLKAALIAHERLRVEEDGCLHIAEADAELAQVLSRLAACGRTSSRLPADFSRKSPTNPLILKQTLQHMNKDKNLPPNPPPSGGTPDLDLADQVNEESTPAEPPVFTEVWQTWPASGQNKRTLAHKHWQTKIAAGLPVERLQQCCLERARDPRAKVVGLASFLRDADFAGKVQASPQAAPLPDPDEEALRRVDTGRLLTWGMKLPLERAYAAIGEAEVRQLARQAMFRQLDHRDSWRLVEAACLKADPSFRDQAMR